MSGTCAKGALRLKRDRDYQGKPKKYSHTYCVVAEGTDELLFRGDVIGRVVSDKVVFQDAAGNMAFSMQPNRKIMPTQWLVRDASLTDIGRIDQLILKGGFWAGFDASGDEVFRIVSAESSAFKVGDFLFGGSPFTYGFVQGNALKAITRQEPRAKATKGGLRGFLQKFTIPSDWVIRFQAQTPDLDIRLVVPAMLLLVDFTIPSSSVG